MDKISKITEKALKTRNTNLAEHEPESYNKTVKIIGMYETLTKDMLEDGIDYEIEDYYDSAGLFGTFQAVETNQKLASRLIQEYDQKIADEKFKVSKEILERKEYKRLKKKFENQ